MKSALGSDFEIVEKAVTETLKWVDDNPNASTEEYENKHKEIEGKLAPIISKAYQANMPSPPEGSMPPNNTSPDVD